jgi:hypothetical protein
LHEKQELDANQEKGLIMKRFNPFPVILITMLFPFGGCTGKPDSASVIVYGGSSSGIMAAVQAARMGESVIIVSPDRHLGGLTSNGLGWTDAGRTQSVGGLAREFYGREYRNPGDSSSGLVPRVSARPPGRRGSADRRVQACCYRMCLSDHPDNRVPFPKPDSYDPDQYELLLRVFATGWREGFQKFDAVPNRKTDTNNHGPFSTDNIGMNYDYPEADYDDGTRCPRNAAGAAAGGHGVLHAGFPQCAALRHPGGFRADIGVPVAQPYRIAYGSLAPRKAECENLLVPVCVSCSHIAFGSIRMEPVFMILGQSAATAAGHLSLLTGFNDQARFLTAAFRSSEV